MKIWLRYRVKLLALTAVLMLLLWALSSLFPRAWDAGLSLFGGASDNPNDPLVLHGVDPALDAPDISPSRLELVHQHQQALEEMSQAFMEMAQGYATMRNPARFAAGQKDVAQASEKLDQASRKGASLAKLEPAEKKALAPLVNNQLKPSAANVSQQLVRLMQTPGISGDFDKLLAAINQAQKQFDREFGSDSPGLSALLVMSKIDDPIQRQIITQKAMALVDRSNTTGAGWGTEGETSRLRVGPVYSAQAYANRINFGKVRSVKGRRIEIDVKLASAEEIAQFKAQRSAPGPQPTAPASQSPAPTPKAAPLPAGSIGPQSGSSPVPAEVSASDGEASILALRWLDNAGDRISAGGNTGGPDGAKDQHLLVEFELPPRCVIEELVLTAGERNRWVTQPSVRYWALAVYQGEKPVAGTYTPRIGGFSGKQTFDLYANTSFEIPSGTIFELQAVVSINGARHTLSSQCKRP